MFANIKNYIKIYFQKFLSYFVILFCFLFFPGFLLFASLDVYFENNAENLKQTKLIEMNSVLEYLNKYSNNKRYFHFLLSKIAEYAQKSSNPKDYLAKNISNIKAKYPDKVQFIVWDNKGKVINELSDRAKYNYILIKLYEGLNEVTRVIKLDSSSKIGDIESIKKNLKMLRTFLGKIFIPENLKIPLKSGFNAGPFLVESGHGLTYVWFKINEKISFLCFLSDDLIMDCSGLENITNSLNKRNFDFIAGYSLSPDYEKPVTNFPAHYTSNIAMALSTFENAGDNISESDKALVRMSMPQPSVRTFCYLPKTDGAWDFKYNRNIWFGILFSGLLLIYCFFGFWFVYKRHFFSIRWKLTILFLFANLAPIFIIGIIGKDYLENQRLTLKNEIVSDLEKSVRELEARYRSKLDDYSIRINTTVNEVFKEIGNKTIEKKEINRLKSLYDEFSASELYIIASNSDMIDSKRDAVKMKMPTDYMTYFGRAVLAFSNNKPAVQNVKQNDNQNQGEIGKEGKKENQQEQETTKKTQNQTQKKSYSDMVKKENTSYIDSFLKNLGTVSDFNVGDIGRIYYSYTFGDRNNYNNNYLFLIFWDKEPLENSFLKDNYKTLYNNFSDADFFIRSELSNSFYGSEKLRAFSNSILDKNSEITEKNNGYIKIDNKNYIFVSLNGSILKNWTLLAVYPEDHINKEINLIIVKIIAGILISILLTIIIIHILSLQFLKPISSLREATLAIDKRNFSYRISSGDKDEFGHLNQVFNRVIEGLGDFEVARIVQESLFPGNEFNIENFKIYGKSVVLTTLGGDYYDCFKINDEYQGIVIGKVSGRGIPAGLKMAMAKSVIITASEELKLDPAGLTSRLNNMFYTIKDDNTKYMMTFQYFVLNIKDGHFKYTNAGHCFPVLVDNQSKTAKYIDYSAFPLGMGKEYFCENKEFYLKAGQSLILYTDAIVKAKNDNGRELGNEKFLASLPEFYNETPEIYYNSIFELVYKKWSSKQEDDITLIIVNR